MINQKELKEVLNYDPLTGEFVRILCRSNRYKPGDKAGTFDSSTGYLRVSVYGKVYYAHRLAWLFEHGDWPKNQIDHINGIRTDNRIENLRDVTNAQNAQNKTKALSFNKSSGLLGVTWSKNANKWAAHIALNKKAFHLGYFTDKYAAQEAYLKRKKILHPSSNLSL